MGSVSGKHVVVIGAGIIGASFAFYLTRAGARVSVLDGAGAGGRATAATWAWLNASWGNPEAYFRLRFESLQRWRRLEQEVAGLELSWGGSLTFDLEPGDLKAYVAEHGCWGYPLRLVDKAEAARLEPGLKQIPELAAFAEAEGAVEHASAVAALLAAASVRVAQAEVQGINIRNGRVVSVMTTAGALACDEVVVAAGAGAASLLATAGVKLALDAPAGLLVHTKPLPRLLTRLVIAPRIHIRQTRVGELVAGSDFGGSPIDAGPEIVADGLMDQIRAMIAGAEQAELHHYTVGYRPTPADGFPIVGRAPGIGGLYVAVMHSGMTNAPAVGAFGAEEILTGERNALLSPLWYGAVIMKVVMANGGASIPAIGLGTWQLTGPDCAELVAGAIHDGYRHIDTAQMYGNEAAVGEGIRASGIGRDQIFLTTKIDRDRHGARDLMRAAEESLARLKMDYVDLLLLHWPSTTIPLKETMPALADLRRRGIARHIGVSNFTIRLLEDALALCDQPIAVNQFEYHPFLDQSCLIAACRQHGIAVTAYSPIARGHVAQSAVLAEIGRAHGKSAVQVCLRWLIQQEGVIAIPRSKTPARIRENIAIQDFTLSQLEMQRIAGLVRADGRLVERSGQPQWD